MGFFDFLKRAGSGDTKKPNDVTPQPDNFAANTSKTDVRMTKFANGKFQIEFFDSSKWKQFYDTTKLIVSDGSYRMGNSMVRNGRISWYNQDDVIFVEGESSRDDMKDIVLSIDLGLMQTDKNYCTYVMRYLLDRNRVRDYLSRGMLDEPGRPCGNYVGYVKPLGDGKFKKYFDSEAGIKAHNSPYMKEKRKQAKEAEKIKQAKKIAGLNAQITTAQRELDELNQ